MKILLKRKFLLISLIVAVLALIITGSVLADTVFNVPAQVNVVAPTYDIGVYSDSACTIPLKNLIWASDLPQGGQRDMILYVKNEGNMDASILATLQNPPSGVTLENNRILVSRGSNQSFDLILQASPTANLGTSQKFTITFTSSALPTTTTTTTQ